MNEDNQPAAPNQPRDPVSRLIGMDVEEYIAADAAARRVRRDDQAVRGIKAWLLAPNPVIYQALMKGERVPWRSLRPQGMTRYGLRYRPTDGRVSLNDFNDVEMR